jgi:hypothetical protein
MFLFKTSEPELLVYNNSIDALIPEMWAQESLAILEENMVITNLINRDFQNEFARAGDIVHTRRPGEFQAYRKGTYDDVTVQDAVSTDIPVKLDQQIHVSFMIRDGEETLAMQDLINTYMKPAMLANARILDQICLGQYAQFIQNSAGVLGGLTASNVKAAILGVREVMNQNKAYPDGRRIIWNPSGETVALSLAEFTQAQDVGDQGFALREASMGRKFGFDNYMSQNMALVPAGNTTSAGAINNAAGYGAGATAVTIDGVTGTMGVNTWLTIAGDNTPQRVVSSTATLGNATGLVLWPGLKNAVVDNAVITFYSPGQINNSGGYAAGWQKALTVDTFSVAPKVGQFVTFGVTDTTTVYTIMQASSTSILLDRPLEAAVADNDKVNLGPAGSYNLAFHRDAMTLVVRPLIPPRAGTGALSATVNYNGLSIRATITYDGTKQGHLITLDFLCGIKVLDTNLGAVLLA